MLKGLYKNLIIKSNPQKYIKFLRKQGMQIGNDVNIWSCRRIVIDETRPWLIKIGNNVNITDGVKILTHGYDWSVLKGLESKVYGSANKVIIGDNVFIGVNSVILKGVTIGDNVVIGAGSIVNKDCESNSVYAGNPAKRVCSIEEYKERLIKKQLKEATICAKEYYKTYNKFPSRNIMSEFIFLYENNPDNLSEVEKRQLKNGGNYNKSIKKLKNNKPIFENYEEFIKTICKD